MREKFEQKMLDLNVTLDDFNQEIVSMRSLSKKERKMYKKDTQMLDMIELSNFPTASSRSRSQWTRALKFYAFLFMSPSLILFPMSVSTLSSGFGALSLDRIVTSGLFIPFVIMCWILFNNLRRIYVLYSLKESKGGVLNESEVDKEILTLWQREIISKQDFLWLNELLSKFMETRRKRLQRNHRLLTYGDITS